MLVGAVVSAATELAIFLGPGQTPHWYMWTPLISLAGPGVIGVVLILLADRLSVWFIPDTGPLAITARPLDLTVLGFALADIFVLIAALQDVASVVYTALTRPFMSTESTSSYLWGSQRIAIVRAIIGATAGLVLIPGGHGLASTARFPNRCGTG